VQIERAKACAILTGTDTVLCDNPQLNVRPHALPKDIAIKFAWRQKQPLRVVVDSKNRLNQQYQMLNDGQATVVYNCSFNVNIEQLSCQQCVISANEQGEYVDLQKVLADLADKEINHVWVEAGASLSGALFDLNLVDQLVLYQAPKLLGKEGRCLTNYKSPDALKNALAGNMTSIEKVGPDSKITIEFNITTSA
jgi:diaminohydroxyphosphoribosylaminopyrimidine deaminase/5-amino-6-(5-phosphoribosylamino)uracil reductase